MSSKKKKSDGRSGELEKAEEVFQAVILTDSFNFRFLPITLETPRVSELQITCSSQLIEGDVRGVRIPQYRTWKRENTAIPHQNLAKYRNRSYKWEKVDVVNSRK